MLFLFSLSWQRVRRDTREKHASLVAMEYADGFAPVKGAKLAIAGISIAFRECKTRGESVSAVAAYADLHIAAVFLFGAGNA